MTTNCEWCESKLEAFFSEELGSEEAGLFQTHLASCEDCSRQVKELRAIDPAIQQVFQRRLSTARSAAQWNTRPRVWRLALTGSAIALAMILGVSVLSNRQQPQQAVVDNQKPVIKEPAQTPVLEAPKEKTSATPALGLGKLDEGKAIPPAPQPELDKRPDNGPEFAIINEAGQSNSLETYRGRVLLFGVVSSDQKEEMTNLQDLYKAFGSNPKVRILAVANHRDDKIEGAAFPVWFNHASKLMGVKNGQFLLMDAAGSSKVKGSLANSADVARAMTQLGQLTK